jgi:ElaB/YqjD/DUF883 family membrane-anchored ribosome-binding protein
LFAVHPQGAEPEQVLEDVMGAGSDVKHAAQRVGGEINDRTESALDKAESALDKARDKADARRKEGQDRAQEMGDRASEKVRHITAYRSVTLSGCNDYSVLATLHS